MVDLTRITNRILARDSAPPARVEDSLDAFGSESAPALRPGWTPPLTPRARKALVIATAAIAVIASGGYALRGWKAGDVAAASASVTIESLPAGAEVFAGGASKGKTPLTLVVPPGDHEFQLVHEGRSKSLRATAREGTSVVHHVEWDPAPPPVASRRASLRITTDPANLRVTVNGVAKGQSPLTLADVKPGRHRIQVAGTSGTIERSVEVKEGEAAAVIVAASSPRAAPASTAGWLKIASPVALQVNEGKEIIGTSASSRIMLPTGRHDLVLSNAELGFTEKRSVQIGPGDNATLKVQLPDAPLSINAQPWAEVWVDGVRVGETPIGNHLVRIGVHEILFRHPELGQRTQTVTVTLHKPARVTVEMRKPGS